MTVLVNHLHIEKDDENFDGDDYNIFENDADDNNNNGGSKNR